MDFETSPNVRALQERLEAFMDEHVCPAEAPQEIALVKVATPDMGCNVIDWAMLVFGGIGTAKDYGLPAAYATARLGLTQPSSLDNRARRPEHFAIT